MEHKTLQFNIINNTLKQETTNPHNLMSLDFKIKIMFCFDSSSAKPQPRKSQNIESNYTIQALIHDLHIDMYYNTYYVMLICNKI